MLSAGLHFAGARFVGRGAGMLVPPRTNRCTRPEPHAPAETGQVVEPAGVGAADGAGRCGGRDRQVDGELLDIETGTDEAAPIGSAQQFEQKHQEAPGAFFPRG
jgi:hypothetical protein